jgi:hypothetical protein
MEVPAPSAVAPAPVLLQLDFFQLLEFYFYQLLDREIGCHYSSDESRIITSSAGGSTKKIIFFPLFFR